MKTYCCSDLHIGSEDARYPEIIEFFDLAQRKADEVILNGDILDLWTNTFENVTTQEPYKTAYDKLIETSNIISTIYVAGNHDFNVKKYLKDTNITVTNRFTRDNIRYIHGYELDIEQMAAYPFYEWILLLCPYIYQKYFYHPQKLKLSQNELINDVARGYVKKNGYKMLCYGHTHSPIISQDGVIVNSGDFVNHSSYVVINDGVPELKSIQ